MIIPVWKPVGPTTHQIAMRFSEERDEKVAHTGSLDPMAEGVAVLLTGEDRFRKDELSDTKKHYRVRVAVGVATDTHDVMGMVEDVVLHTVRLSDKRLTEAIASFKGEIEQKPPLFSAPKVNGKSLFDHAKAGTITFDELPEYERRVYSVRLVETELIGLRELVYGALENIESARGDYRQAEITRRWKQAAMQLPGMLQIVEFECVTGPGTYVRSIVRDLSWELAVPLMVFSLVRFRNGSYGQSDCRAVVGG